MSEHTTENDYFQAGYDLGMQDLMLRATQYERILTELIAELRDKPLWDVWDHAGQFACIPATPVKRAADRAEARLSALVGAEIREVSDE